MIKPGQKNAIVPPKPKAKIKGKAPPAAGAAKPALKAGMLSRLTGAR